MLRQIVSAAAALAATFTAISALADTPAPQKVSVNAKGEYCMSDAAITGSRVGRIECHSAAKWAQLGVTLAPAPKQVAAK